MSGPVDGDRRAPRRLVAAAVVPAAPALLPGLGGAADPLAPLRERSRTLVDELAALAMHRRAQRLVVLGDAALTRRLPLDAPSGAARFGTGRVPSSALPTSLEIGRALLGLDGREGRERWTGPGVGLLAVARDAGPRECIAWGAALADVHDVALLVVADGPAALTERAPGHLHPDAEGVGRAVHEALAHGDPTGLVALEPDLCDRVWMRGRAPLQVLAGAADGAVAEGRLSGEVLLDEAPYGVQYLLARWS